MEEKEVEQAQLDISEAMNTSGVFNRIQVIAKRFGKDISNDDEFWGDLEEHIVKSIREFDD